MSLCAQPNSHEHLPTPVLRLPAGRTATDSKRRHEDARQGVAQSRNGASERRRLLYLPRLRSDAALGETRARSLRGRASGGNYFFAASRSLTCSFTFSRMFFGTGE